MADNKARQRELQELKELEELAELERLESVEASSPKTQPPQISPQQAIRIGAERALTLGTRPLFVGAARGIAEEIEAFKTGRQLGESIPSALGRAARSFFPGVEAGRKEAIEEQARASREQPLSTAAGSVAGGVATAPLFAARTLGGAIAGGAALGAAGAAGEAQTPQQALEETILSAGLGGAFKKLGDAAGAGAEQLKQLRNTKAFKAAGAMLKDFRKAFRKEKLDELGQFIVDNKLIGLGDDIADIAGKSEALKIKTGQQIGQIYDQVLDAITDQSRLGRLAPDARATLEASGFRPASQQKEMLAAVERTLRGKPGASSALGSIQGIIGDIAENGDAITPQQALQIKGQIDDLINFSKRSDELPIKQEGLLALRNFVNDKILKQVELADQLMPSPQVEQLKQLNRTFGNASEIANVAKDRVSREQANKFFGVRDTLLGTAGGLGGFFIGGEGATLEDRLKGAALGTSLGLASKGARTFGPALGVKTIGGAARGAGALSSPAGTGLLIRGGVPAGTAIDRRLRGE